MENTITEEQLLEQLNNGIVTVTFTKIDGTVRNMNCTLQECWIPEKNVKDNKAQERTQGLLTVWCTDKHEWRSFWFNRVIESWPVDGATIANALNQARDDADTLIRTLCMIKGLMPASREANTAAVDALREHLDRLQLIHHQEFGWPELLVNDE